MSSSSTSCAFLRQHISGALGSRPNPLFFFTTWDQMKQCGIAVSLPDGELRSAMAMAREMVKHKRLPHLYGRFLPGIERLMGRALAGVDEMGDEMGGGMAEKIKGFARGMLSPTTPKPIQILIFAASFLLFFGLTVCILVRFLRARNEGKKKMERERELWFENANLVENANRFEMVYVEGESGREEVGCREERLESEGESMSEHLDWVKVESRGWNWIKGDGGKDVIVWREVQW